MTSVLLWVVVEPPSRSSRKAEMKNSGKILKLEDGRMGIAYNREQVHKEKFTIKLFDKDYKPIISEHTGKQAVVFRKHDEVTLIGYTD